MNEKVVDKQKEGILICNKKRKQREEALHVETNETVKKALVQEAEKEVLKLMEQLQNVSEGDLKELEQTVMTAYFLIRRNCLEQAVNHQGQESPPARRQAECEHRQRLVGERPKQLLTLMGKVTMRRG